MGSPPVAIKGSTQSQANADDFASTRHAAIDHAGVAHDDNELQALEHRRGPGVRQAHGRKIAKLVEQQAKGGKEQQLFAVGGCGPELNQALAVARYNHGHKE